MAYNPLFCFFIVTVVLLCFASSPSFATNYGEEDVVEPAEKVNLSLYYETLCPYCADFIVNHLVKVFDLGLISIVNLRMVPWGNAWLDPDGSFVCQHGPDECFLNAIEACTITIYPDVERHFSFIHCIERLILDNRTNEWSNCFDLTRLGDVPEDCYKTGYGKVLEQQYANETAKLNPPHRFVPWVVVNNQALQEDYGNFISYICDAYKGDRVPDACRSHSLDNNLYGIKANSMDRGCYVDEWRNLTSLEEKDADKLKMQP